MTVDLLGAPEIVPARTIPARAVATLATSDPKDFETAPVDPLLLTLEGIPGDRHAGFIRRAGGREPWYPRGTEIRSGRQLSVVSVEELAEVASAMSLKTVEPGWIGANIVLSGAPRLSFLPAGTRIVFESGAAIVVEGQNAPCRFAGRAIARRADSPCAELSFPRVAKGLRGVVASVERAGDVRPGETMLRIPPQWIYDASR
jgi:hypothetical protein